MATLIAKANGNWTEATTWAVVDSTSLLTGAGNLANTPLTTYADSAAFTPGQITINGIGLRFFLVPTTTTGTLAVCLRRGGATVAGTEVVINTADLSTGASGEDNVGWVIFAFAAPVTLAAATAYTVAVKASAITNLPSICYLTSNTNWYRMLRLAGSGAGYEQAPAAGDTIHVLGELTGAGTGNNLAVTMNNTTTDAYNGVWVGKRGTLSYGTAAGTAYYLRLAAAYNLEVKAGGIFNIGANGAAIPATSSAVLEFNCAADGDAGLVVRNGGTLNIYGNPLAYVADLLASNVAANAGTFTTAHATGWAANDVLALASTSRTYSETEQVTTSGASDTTVTVSVGGGTGGNTVKYAHSLAGNSVATPVACEIINLTRNVKVRAANALYRAFVNLKATSVVHCEYAEFSVLGKDTATQRGIEIETTAGSCAISYCSFHDFNAWGWYLASASGSGIALDHNVCFNLNTAAAANTAVVYVTASAGVSIVSNNYIIGCRGSGANGVVYFADVGLTFQNNVLAGNTQTQLYLAETGKVLGTFADNLVHSCQSIALYLGSGFTGGVFGAFTGYRNGAEGLRFGGDVQNANFDSQLLFGNLNQNIYFSAACQGQIIFKSPIVRSDASYATSYGLVCNSTIPSRVLILGGSFGSTVAHTGSDIYFSTGSNSQVVALGTTFADAPPVAGTLYYNAFVRVHKFGGIATDHRAWYAYGTLASELTTRHTASGLAWKLTPNNATNKLRFPGPTEYDTFQAPVSANAAVTVTAWVYYDDTYNGAMPRLVLVGGLVAGIDADVVATAPGSHVGEWQQLSVMATPTEAGVVDFYLDCDGTAGNVYVDDAAVTQAGAPTDTGLLDVVARGMPVRDIFKYPASGGGGALVIGSSIVRGL
jgi:hypothetical protein